MKRTKGGTDKRRKQKAETVDFFVGWWCNPSVHRHQDHKSAVAGTRLCRAKDKSKCVAHIIAIQPRKVRAPTTHGCCEIVFEPIFFGNAGKRINQIPRHARRSYYKESIPQLAAPANPTTRNQSHNGKPTLIGSAFIL